MVHEKSSPKEGTDGEQQHETSPWGMKLVHCWNQKQKHWGQHNMELLFARTISDVTCMSPWRRRNGNTLVGYLGCAASWREWCVVMAEHQNREKGRWRPLLGTVNILLYQWFNTQQRNYWKHSVFYVIHAEVIYWGQTVQASESDSQLAVGVSG
jgi:hypothetical protein